MTNSQNLENLVRTGALKKETPDRQEFEGLLQTADRCLRDAVLPGITHQSSFTLAYHAAYALAQAAIRWHGYRADNRYLVFQCLLHTTGLSREQCRIFSACHEKRNLAEYEGDYLVSMDLLAEFIEETRKLQQILTTFGPLA